MLSESLSPRNYKTNPHVKTHDTHNLKRSLDVIKDESAAINDSKLGDMFQEPPEEED